MLIKKTHGYIQFNWKHDLNAEEGDHYLPSFYDGKVIELAFIRGFDKGEGHKLMRAFLMQREVQAAKAIFLDCSPLHQRGSEAEIMQRLHDFYAHYGFTGKTTDGYSRMWLFLEFPPEQQRFPFGYDAGNDLHPVLLAAAENATQHAASQ